MPEPIPTALGLALTYLRSKLRWTKRRLADALGMRDDSVLTRYERGDRDLSRPALRSLLAPLPLEDPDQAVDVLVFAHSLIFPDTPEDSVSATTLTAKDRRTIDRAAMAAGLAAAMRADLTRQKKSEKTEEARMEAEALWARLRAAPREDRRDLIVIFPEFRSVPLAVRVCEASVRAAADDAGKALELAELALFIAARVAGEESLRSRVQGYGWAHVGNARRVANKFDAADSAFARAWDLWRAGAESDPGLLPEWRLLDLEASLRGDKRQFAEALDLLDRARPGSGADPVAAGRILLNKEYVFDQMGDKQGALAALAEAAPFIEGSRDPQLLLSLRFKTAKHLCYLERYEEAALLLPKVRELVVEQADELNLLRVLWLQSRLAAGQGRVEEAIEGLEQVRQAFMDREMPYDAALASLDLAVLWLKVERTAKVRKLAVAMEGIFRAKGIDREALAALRLFCEAAKQEAATVELTQSVITAVEEGRRSASRGDSERRGRG